MARSLVWDTWRVMVRDGGGARCASRAQGIAARRSQHHRVSSRGVRHRLLAGISAVIASLFLLGLLGAGCKPKPVVAPTPRPVYPFVVTIVIDQFAAWVAADRLDVLPKDGGFARLRSSGTWVKDMRYAHAATDTAPGHAALYTGAPPIVTGIFANEWVDEESGKRRSILRDAATRLVTTAGPIEQAGSSLERLSVETLADRFRARYPDARIVSLSLKDRGALFGAGRKPTTALWWNPEVDAFVTSTAFAEKVPAWAAKWAAPKATDAMRQIDWAPRDEMWLRAHVATRDDQPGEGDFHGLGTTFPHRAAKASMPAGAMRATPMADELLVAMAMAAVDGENMRDHPSLLALSLSANDYIGHFFGPESWEAWDELLRLDALLAKFMSDLDRTVGEGSYALVLSADHGVTPMVETVPNRPWCKREDRWQRPCLRGTRIHPDDLARDLEKVGVQAVGRGHWIAGVADPFVIYTKAVESLSPAKKQRLRTALRKRLLAHPGVAAVMFPPDAAPACSRTDDDSVPELVCRSLPQRSDIAAYVVPKPGSYFDADYTPGFGASHGTPYIFDRAVPMFARAPGRVRAGDVIDTPVSFATFARTVAALAGMDPPSAAWSAEPLVTNP